MEDVNGKNWDILYESGKIVDTEGDTPTLELERLEHSASSSTDPSSLDESESPSGMPDAGAFARQTGEPAASPCPSMCRLTAAAMFFAWSRVWLEEYG